jgi:uncharacterized protein involved in type VI secretion and phage assembly
MMESLFGPVNELMENASRRFYGVVTGQVKSTDDPMNLGRVQIELPFISSTDSSPWARVAVPMAGSTHGFYFPLEVGQEVLVAFEHGDMDVPYVLGSLWNAMAPPPPLSPEAQANLVRTVAGNEILFNDSPPSITIKTPNEQTIHIAPEGIKLESGSSSITITPKGEIKITAGTKLTLEAKAEISLKAASVSIEGTGSLSLKGGATCSINAGMVKIN